MTSSHIIFIPGVLIVGVFLGIILGARAARNQFELQQRRAEEREATRAARAAKRAAAGGAGAPADDGHATESKQPAGKSA